MLTSNHKKKENDETQHSDEHGQSWNSRRLEQRRLTRFMFALWKDVFISIMLSTSPHTCTCISPPDVLLIMKLGVKTDRHWSAQPPFAWHLQNFRLLFSKPICEHSENIIPVKTQYMCKKTYRYMYVVHLDIHTCTMCTMCTYTVISRARTLDEHKFIHFNIF